MWSVTNVLCAGKDVRGGQKKLVSNENIKGLLLVDSEHMVGY